MVYWRFPAWNQNQTRNLSTHCTWALLSTNASLSCTEFYIFRYLPSRSFSYPTIHIYTWILPVYLGKIPNLESALVYPPRCFASFFVRHSAFARSLFPGCSLDWASDLSYWINRSLLAYYLQLDEYVYTYFVFYKKNWYFPFDPTYSFIGPNQPKLSQASAKSIALSDLKYLQHISLNTISQTKPPALI